MLLTIGIGLYGYNYTTLAGGKSTLNSIAGSLQSVSIPLYDLRVYDKFGNAPAQNNDRFAGNPPAARRLLCRKAHKKTDAVIFGSHDENTLAMIANISDYWTPLGCQDRELHHVLPQWRGQQPQSDHHPAAQRLASRFRESYLTTSADERRAEMLQQANMLDERESFPICASAFPERLFVLDSHHL